MSDKAAFLAHVETTLATIRDDGLFKHERLIGGPQGAHVAMDGRSMLNLCANNYLGLADDPRLIAAAKAAQNRTAKITVKGAKQAANEAEDFANKLKRIQNKDARVTAKGARQAPMTR